VKVSTATWNKNWDNVLPEVQLIFLEVPCPCTSLGNYVWEDANGNGQQDGTVVGLPGVSVNLTGTDIFGNPVNLNQVTGAAGEYLFTNLVPGTYKVTFGTLAGYVRTVADTGADATDSDADTATGMTGNYVLAAGDSNLTVDAGLVLEQTGGGCTFTIGYYKNHPAAIQPLPIYLGTVGGPKTLVVTSTAMGVNVLGQKTYGKPSNGITKLYAQLLAAKISIANDADPAAVSSFITQADLFLATHDHNDWSGLSSAEKGLVLGWHTQIDNYNNGIIGPGHCDDGGTDPGNASISGFVYVDHNNNGLKEAGEQGIPNVVVVLDGVDSNGAPVHITTTTNADGFYNFDNLLPGTYRITESQPAGYVDGLDTIGTPGGTSSNDVFSNIVLAAGVNGANNNFGERLPVLLASLSGYVYLDCNDNGLREAGEAGLGGVKVTLTGTDDLGAAVNVVAYTGPDGGYMFIKLRPGTYTLTETQPGTHLDGKDTIGTPGGTTSNDKFSNIVVISGTVGTENNFGEKCSAPPVLTGGCTRTIGYYKTRKSAIRPLPIHLGDTGGAKTVVVTTANMGVDVLKQSVFGTPSNGITKLYAQLLAAKLNILRGTNPAAVAGIIDDIDAFLATHNWLDWPSLSAADQDTILNWHGDLDDYNNGLIGPVHCD